MVEALRLLSKASDLSSRLQEHVGRKPPEAHPEQEVSETLQHANTSLESKEPRTPPPEGATGRLRRLGKMPDWDLRILYEAS